MADDLIDDTTIGNSGYRVRRGDSIASIAAKQNLLPDTIWLHAQNSELRKLRQDPDLLLEGDRVFVPESSDKKESCATENTHRFRRKGIPRILRIRLHDCINEPLANEKFQIDIDGQLSKGSTDADGWIEHPIDPLAKKAKVILASGDVFDFDLGFLSPPNTTLGVQQRLRNLGFYVGPLDGHSSDDMMLALIRFQASEDLDPSGEIDDATVDVLARRCAC